ncbi:BREX-1 system phosphatase PglZ type A, partial [bacterium]
RALLSALDLTLLVNEDKDGFAFPSAEAMYRAYEGSLYRFDQLYRQFCEAADAVEAQGWDILKALRGSIESAYGNGFLLPLAMKWGDLLQAGLLSEWRIPGVPNQWSFFERHVRGPLKGGETKRAYVVVSDALRFEAAHELASELNGRYRFAATLSSQLGVLPSITRLGMASLLPHGKLSLTDQGDVLADGQSTSGTANRKKLLSAHGGTAVTAEDLLAMRRDEARAAFKDCEVVYVYHNAIDSVGDSAATQGETFQGVRRAVEELLALTRFIVNSLNGSYVVLTADHGFLFQKEPPTSTEKSGLSTKPHQPMIEKKRYVLGRSLGVSDQAYVGSTDATANTDDGAEFWVPKGINRFHFSGGAQYYHGGAMLQEIVVPVIVVREKESDDQKPRPVAVHVLGSSPKITTNAHRFQLLQADAVSARRSALTVKLAIYDGEREISNVATVTLDSPSDSIDERSKTVFLTLKSGNYDRNKPYHLILRNAEDQVELQRIEVAIDLSIQNDF